MKTSMIRTRWAAVGAAVAVTLGIGGVGFVSATTPADATAYVPIEPCRIADTRSSPEFNVGPRSTPLGAEETDVITAHGDNGECTGIPTSATGLQLNVTALNATLGTFLVFWGSGDQPNASNLNPQPGQPPIPNAVTTGLDGDGAFSVFNRIGSVDFIVDIVGYYADHHHVGTVDVRQGLSSMEVYYQSGVSAIEYRGGGTRVDDNGGVVISLDGPYNTDGFRHRLVSFEYCIEIDNDRFIDEVVVWNESGTDSVVDGTNRTATGCYVVDMGTNDFEAYGVVFEILGGSGDLDFDSMTTKWEPASTTSTLTKSTTGSPASPSAEDQAIAD